MKKSIRFIASVLTVVCSSAQYGCVIAQDYSENVGSIFLDDMSVSGDGISAEGNVIKISEPGDFIVTGSNEDAMIYVNVDGRVKLRLSGVNLSNSSGPAIFFDNVEKGFITVTEGTENFVSDSFEYSYDAKAAIFSNDDLEIKGNGTLTVSGNYKHGIASDDDIKIENSVLNISAVTDDIHVNNTFEMTGGTLNIAAGSDGIQAEEDVVIDGGIINVSESEEGIESGTAMTVNGGEINIVSTDDGLNSGGGNGQFSDGAFGGMNRERQNINPDVNGVEMPERIFSEDNFVPGEMPPDFQQNGQPFEGGAALGDINNRGRQEGIQPPEMREQNIDGGVESVGNTDKSLYINGGIIKISAQGDGVDSNGDVYMTGGKLYIDGPTGGGDGAIDCGKFVISGGTVIAVGSSAMAMGMSGESTQAGLMINLDEVLSAGSDISIKDSAGETIMSYTSEKDFSSVVYSSDKLAVGESYEMYADGELIQSIEMSDSQTEVGSRGFGGGFKGGMGNRFEQMNIEKNQQKSGRIKIILDGTEIKTQTESVISEDSVLVPVRAVLEALGMEVDWNEETSEITAQKEGIVIKMQIGNKTAFKNGEVKELIKAPEIRNSSTLVPVRFVAEALGLEVNWNEETKSVEINRNL